MPESYGALDFLVGRVARKDLVARSAITDADKLVSKYFGKAVEPCSA
jgi:hypothetical protein